MIVHPQQNGDFHFLEHRQPSPTGTRCHPVHREQRGTGHSLKLTPCKLSGCKHLTFTCHNLFEVTVQALIKSDRTIVAAFLFSLIVGTLAHVISIVCF